MEKNNYKKFPDKIRSHFYTENKILYNCFMMSDIMRVENVPSRI